MQAHIDWITVGLFCIIALVIVGIIFYERKKAAPILTNMAAVAKKDVTQDAAAIHAKLDDINQRLGVKEAVQDLHKKIDALGNATIGIAKVNQEALQKLHTKVDNLSASADKQAREADKPAASAEAPLVTH